MRIKSQKDFASGLMFIIVGIAFAWGATEYSFGDSARPGPGYFPFGLGILLAILGALVTFGSLTIETEDGEPIGHIGWKPLFIIVGSVVLFAAALPRLGLLIALPLLVIVASLAGDEFNWRDAIIAALVLTALSWFVFSWALNLVIPLWPAWLSQ
ncbi:MULTISPECIES: tripartite tricarboxylate transporter TctB family protein [Caldimonas]|uniref:tripartite tricarboxylate transporter TctB family protein n=1 Tax=Caldimonas TaxID=196013 RepID=UPI00039FFB8F|nr:MULTISPECIES: tripartite tricarboxylate transporter TctB family protein [Caldimonas]MCX7660276.1 tripartite tricarboxylate transporter TctB family protein [Caldimonas manganoxidans]